MEEIIKDWRENAEKKEEETFYFIRSLKMLDSNKVDKNAKRLHEEAFTKIDCLSCGNCCKSIKPLITEKDKEKISAYMKLSIEEIELKYLELDSDNEWTVNNSPCPFLSENNECSIYEFRPEACRSFPHTHKDGFARRSYQHTFNTIHCPITYYIVEELKKVM